MFIILIIILAIFYYNMNERGSIKFNEKDNALVKLKERYINGEIDEETYLKMKKVLKE